MPLEHRGHGGAPAAGYGHRGLVPADAERVAGVRRTELLAAAARLRDALGLSLFGADLILESAGAGVSSEFESSGSRGIVGQCEVRHSPRRLLVVDVNPFPSYTELPDFSAALRFFLRGEVVKRRHQLKFSH